MKWLLSQVAQATHGRLIGADVEVTGVSTDTRTVTDGQLFIALSGERFDAHDFLDQAVAAGAAALLVSNESKVPAGVPSSRCRSLPSQARTARRRPRN